jgi:hypothetical protein
MKNNRVLIPIVILEMLWACALAYSQLAPLTPIPAKTYSSDTVEKQATIQMQSTAAVTTPVTNLVVVFWSYPFTNQNGTYAASNFYFLVYSTTNLAKQFSPYAVTQNHSITDLVNGLCRFYKVAASNGVLHGASPFGFIYLGDTSAG